MKHFIIYQIRNKLNGMIYVGKHMTENLDDGYMGSGLRIRRAIEKYGVDNFEKTILHECASEQEMNDMEAEIVNEDFISRDDVYNIIPGGLGGFQYVNESGMNIYPNWVSIDKRSREIFEKTGKYPSSGWQSRMRDKNPERYEKFRKNLSNSIKRHIKEYGSVWSGRKHSDETKRKMQETHEKNHYQAGDKNSQYGTVCMFNETIRKTIHVKPDEIQKYLENGWKTGAVYNWDRFFSRQKESKHIKTKPKTIKPKTQDKTQIYSEMYDFYCEHGWKETVIKYDYKYSHPNFTQQCKRYVRHYNPQNGKKRGLKQVNEQAGLASVATAPHL